MTSKTKRSAKSPRGKHGKKKRGKRKHLGLAGYGDFAAKNPMAARAVNETGNVLGLISGLVAGAMVKKGGDMVIDKFFPMTEEQKAADKFHWKKLLSPALTIGLGGGVTAIGNKLGAEGSSHTIHGSIAKHVGYGIMGAGAVLGVKDTLNKDILAGLSGAGEDTAEEAKFFKESADMLKQLVKENEKFTPELPSGTDGIGFNPPEQRVREQNMQIIM